MTRYSSSMRDILTEMREGYSPKQIKMAIGIASDKRYAGGNMTGAVNAIEKIKKGLSNHPQVAAVLKRQNEDIQEEPASPDEGSMAVQQLEFMMHAVERTKMHIQSGGEFPEWMQNKLSGAHEKMKGLYANIEHGDMNEEVQLDEALPPHLAKLFDKDGNFKDPKKQKVFDRMMGDGIGKEIAQKMGRIKFRVQADSAKKKVMVYVDQNDESDAQKALKNHPAYVSGALRVIPEAVNLEEGTWHMADNPKDIAALKKLMSKPIKLGKEGDDAVDVIGRFIGDDELYDNLYVDGNKNPNGDARKTIIKWFQNRIKKNDYGLGPTTKELGKQIGLKMEYVPEEVELEEKLKVSDGLGAWIDDFKKSDAPQFAGKSDEEKKNMAIAAFTDAGGKLDEGFFSKEYEPGQYKNGDEKPFVDAIKKAGGKNIEVEKPTRRDPMLTIEFDGDVKKAQKEVSKVGDGTEDIDESVNEMREPYAVVDTADGNKVVGTASDEKGAKSIITTSQLPPMKIKDKKTLKIVKVKKKQMIGQPIKEEEEPQKPDSAKEVEQGREDKKKTRIAQLQLQIAKAQETINKLNAQENNNA